LERLEDRCLLSYSVTDLGTLGGSYITSAAYGINAAGQVVGDTNGANLEAFLWQNGIMQDLGIHGQASGINNANPVQVVGTIRPSNSGPYAFLWQNGTTQNLGQGSATAVNDSGQVIGSSGGAFLWQNGTLQNLGTLKSTDGSVATAINNLGQVVGYSVKVHTIGKENPIYPPPTTETDTAFLWQNGKMISLGTLGGRNSDAYAINDLGQVVGSADTKISSGHVFLWDSTHGMQDLGFQGQPMTINAAGQIFGTTGGAGALGSTVVFVWQNGLLQLQDLNALIPAGSGWVLEAVTAFNGSGQIVGWGTINGYVHGFLLTPSTTITALAQPTAITLTTTSTELLASTGVQKGPQLDLVIGSAALTSSLQPSTPINEATGTTVPPGAIFVVRASGPAQSVGRIGNPSYVPADQPAPKQPTLIGDKVFAGFWDQFPEFAWEP
jgi:probable HAF family extracellular repeat protein